MDRGKKKKKGHLPKVGTRLKNYGLITNCGFYSNATAPQRTIHAFFTLFFAHGQTLTLLKGIFIILRTC